MLRTFLIIVTTVLWSSTANAVECKNAEYYDQLLAKLDLNRPSDQKKEPKLQAKREAELNKCSGTLPSTIIGDRIEQAPRPGAETTAVGGQIPDIELDGGMQLAQ